MDKRTVKTIAGIAGGSILLYWLLQNLVMVEHFALRLFSLFSPLLLGAIIAFVFNVPMRAIENKLPAKLKGFRRPLAMLLTLLCLLSILVFVLLLLVPQLNETIRTIAQHLPGFWAETQQFLSKTMLEYPVLEQWLSHAAEMDWQNLLSTVFEWAKRGGLALVGNAATAATGLVSGVVNFFFGVVFAIYILSQKEKLSRQFKMLLYAYIPTSRAEQALNVLQLTSKTFTNFLSGQCIEACILGGMFAIGMLLFRMPYVALISVLIAVTALIPVFGAFIGCFVGAFLILVENPGQAFWFIILFLVIQQLEGNLIYPRVVGSSVGLPSIWVLLAVTIGGSTLGVLGMLIMIPLFSVLYTLLRGETRHRLQNRGIPNAVFVNEPPAPPTPPKKTKKPKK